MEGVLKKWINFVYGWQPRYFVLHEGILIYCQNKGGEKKGSIYLKIATISVLPEDPLRIVINSGTQEIHVRAYSISEKIKWLEALKKAQEEATAKEGVSLDNIEDMEKGLSPESKRMFKDSKVRLLTDQVGELWSCQAEIDETLSMLLPKLERIPDALQLADKLGRLGDEMKRKIALCVTGIEDERKKLIRITKVVEGSSKAGSRSYAPTPRNQILPGNYEAEYDDMQNETQFQSFSSDDILDDEGEEEKEFAPSPLSVGNARGLKPSRNVIPDDSDNMIIPVQNTTKLQKEKWLASLNPQKVKLLTTSPAFIGMEIPTDHTRKKLPHFLDPNQKINVWSILKDSIGKDLSKFAVPVYLNEPLSMLQRLCEQNEYHDLLNVASTKSDSCLRMAYVMGWAVSVYAATIGRIKKPFNPLLGETFEYTPVDKSFRYLAEQVSHHPPISCGYAESELFEWWADTNVKTSFGGNSLEFKPCGSRHVTLKKHKEHYIFKPCVTGVQNLVFGTMYIDNYGDMTFKNYATQDTGVLTLTKKGWNNKGQYEINGSIKDRNGKLRFNLKGKWNESLKAINADTKEELSIWNRKPVLEDWEKQYCFTQFGLQLNYLNQETVIKAAHTDSRFRPDQRALEYGNTQLAIDEKLRLEKKQRTRRTEMQASNEEHQPRWFREVTDDLTGEKYFKYMGNYWEGREKGDFGTKPLVDLY
jgi:hypothetical protein